MSLFDKAINAASDIARTSADNYRRAQQRKAVFDQIAFHEQTIATSLARIGRITLDAGPQRVPAAAGPAVQAIRSWEADIAALQQQLAAVDAQAAARYTGTHPAVGG